MSGFGSLAPQLEGIDAPTAAEVIGASVDVAIVLDADGTVLEVSGDSRSIGEAERDAWVGQPWADTVAMDSRDKVAELLSLAQPGRQRQVNQKTVDGHDVLVAYAVVRLNSDGHLIALGKDLSSLTRMQQRLVNVQQSMERDYSKLRQFETRYRLLFRTAPEAILIATAANARIVEANPAACEMLDTTERRLVGSALPRWFDDAQRAPFEDALAALRLGGKSVTIALPDETQPLLARLSVFKTESQAHLLVRLQHDPATGHAAGGAGGDHAARLAALVEHVPDALVVTDPKGLVLTANTEFMDMAQAASLEHAVDKPLADWLGQGGIDYDVIMASLREHGSIRLYTTQMLGEFGSVTDVEVSAVSIDQDDLECIGFSIRNVGRRVAANDDSAQLSPRSVDQLTHLVGRVPLKELVRESTDLIEQLCVQAALKLTGNNRASAAEMLGLSRQSLYVKLRRYSLVDDDDGSDSSSGPGQSRGRR